jgi:hypothetical protein
MNISDILSVTGSSATPQVQSINGTSAPDDTQVIVPPLASFNTIASESTEIKPVPEGDAGSVGGHGEVPEVVQGQPDSNNIAAELIETGYLSGPAPPQRHLTGKRVRDYLRTVKKRAQTTDLEFRRKRLPYRFKILTDDNENVLIDLSVLNPDGSVVRHETRNVTNDNFGRLMDDISSGKGLLIDDLPPRQ